MPGAVLDSKKAATLDGEESQHANGLPIVLVLQQPEQTSPLVSRELSDVVLLSSGGVVPRTPKLLGERMTRIPLAGGVGAYSPYRAFELLRLAAKCLAEMV